MAQALVKGAKMNNSSSERNTAKIVGDSIHCKHRRKRLGEE